jgi:succinyl-CoA synthetase beta subunit
LTPEGGAKVAKLLEYQGKELFRRFKIPTPRGKEVRSVAEAQAAAEEIGYPVALKAQIYAGKRGMAGGVRMAANEAELLAAATEMLASTIRGLPVDILLVEQKIDIRRELYLGITADPGRRAPVVMLCAQGGIDIEETALNRPEEVHRLHIDILRDLYIHDALNLLRDVTSLSSKEKLQVAQIVCRLYELFRKYDCRLVEINPLCLTGDAAVALDARVDLDDDALGRHPDLQVGLAEEAGDRGSNRLEQIAGAIDQNDHRGTVHFVQIDPDLSFIREQGYYPVGFDCVGAGASLTRRDERGPLGFYPVNFCDSSGNPVGSKLYRITRIIFSQPGIQGYVFVSCISSQQLDNTARGIIKALRELYPESGGQPSIPTVLAFRGAWDQEAVRLLNETGIAQGRWVRVMGREATEQQIAESFRELHESWRLEMGGAV